MLAAEVAIRQLQEKATSAAADAAKAKAAADRTEKSAKRWKVLSAVLGFCVALLIASTCVLGYNVDQTSVNASGLRQQIIASCVQTNDTNARSVAANNSTKALDKGIWDAFISLLLQGNPNPKAKAIGAAFETKVALAYAPVKFVPKNCVQTYQNTTGSGASPASGTPKADDVRVTWSVVQLRNWNGACLTIATARVGARISETNCAHAHAWVYGTNGQLSPQGHTNVAAGDSGGAMVLKAPGTKSLTNGVKLGPSGFTYYRMSFGVRGTYWYAHGAGKYVTLSGRSANADYWAFLGNAASSARSATL